MLHERHFRAMNTDVGVWVWSTAAVRAPIIGRSLEWAEGVFARVEDELSRFRSTSALSRLNQAAGRGPQAVSPLLWTVLRSALQAADDSGGIYDPTLLRTLERIGYDRSFEAIQGCAAEAIASRTGVRLLATRDGSTTRPIQSRYPPMWPSISAASPRGGRSITWRPRWHHSVPCWWMPAATCV